MEFELKEEVGVGGRLRYANNSQYKNDVLIRKECKVHRAVLEEVKRIVRESTVLTADDGEWPEPDRAGRQELEIVLDEEHISFTCSKLGSLTEIAASKNPETLRNFYYLTQDLKCLIFSIVTCHFKVSGNFLHRQQQQQQAVGPYFFRCLDIKTDTRHCLTYTTTGEQDNVLQDID